MKPVKIFTLSEVWLTALLCGVSGVALGLFALGFYAVWMGVSWL